MVGVGIDRAGRAFIIEGDIAPGYRGLERPAGIRDAAAGFLELVEDFRLLRVAEVEAVGDAERYRTGAGDVASRLGDRCLAAFVGIERQRAGSCSPP